MRANLSNIIKLTITLDNFTRLLVYFTIIKSSSSSSTIARNETNVSREPLSAVALAGRLKKTSSGTSLIDSFRQKDYKTNRISTETERSRQRLFLRDLPNFSIEKDPTDPSSLLNVVLPKSPSHFRQYIAKVVDISPNIEPSIRDINRTYLASPSDFQIINIHGLHPGHKYSISVIGRRDGESELIKEETIVTDPVAPNFDSASIVSSHTNITLRALKPEKALQDTYRISYVQLDPLRYFPKLEVNDISEQDHIEIYLGNLSPGRDYNVTVTPQINEMEGQPWKGTLTTKPYSPENVTIVELNSTCVRLSWILTKRTGADRIAVSYKSVKGNAHTKKLNVLRSESFVDICDGLLPGYAYTFVVRTEKRYESSEAVALVHLLKPKTPSDLQILTDYEKRKFRLTMDIASELESNIDKCSVSFVNENFESIEVTSSVETVQSTSSPRQCSLYINLHPGQRYEVSAKTISENVSSNIIAKSFALQPAFDMTAFGMSLIENDGSLVLSWPQSEMARARLEDIWTNLVGDDSTLHLRVEPQNRSILSNELPKRFQRRRTDTEPLTVPNLSRGACYKVQVYTVTSSGIASTEKFEKLMRLSPPRVAVLPEEISKSGATFRITHTSQASSDASACNLHVVVLDTHSLAVFDRTTPLTTEISPIVLQGLRSYHRYTINSQVMCGKTSDTECPGKVLTMEAIEFETRQDRPGPIQNLTVLILNPYSVQLIWLPPALPNGIITHYIVGIHPMDEERERDWSVTVAGTRLRDDTVHAIVDNLVGGLKYRFDVRGVTEAGEGAVSAASDAVYALMPLLPPPRPSSRIEIVYNTIHSTDLAIRYTTAMFNSKHGYLTKSEVIVSEVQEKDLPSGSFEDSNKTVTWGQTRKFAIWQPYVAVQTPIEPARKYFPTRTVSEVIGADQACADIEEDAVCNGPLKPSTSYRFKLRLYTSFNLWTDSDYSEVATTRAAPSLFTVNGLIVVLVLPFVLTATLITGLLAWRKRKKSCPPTYGSCARGGRLKGKCRWVAFKMMMAERAADCLAKLGLDQAETSQVDTSPNPNANLTINQKNNVENAVNDLSTTFGHHRRSRSLRERTGVDQRLERLPSGPTIIQKFTPHTVIPGSITEKSRPVRISDFAEHVRLMSADSDFRFSEEYEDLKLVGHGLTCIAADLTVNRAKNRFTNILPYDHSRVKLIPTDDDDGSDYVNASFIPGFNSRREFIAAQGPLPSTRDHFWRVVWEQQCPAIVALTKCVEKGRDKCHQYWPDRDQLSVLYADIEVTLMNETVYEEFTIRELRLTNMNEPNSRARTVKHLHYMAWPDFGVPEFAAGLVRFVRIFRSHLLPSPANKPTIVHCSAGVGRSGTFVALDRLMQCVAHNMPLDIFGIVYEMRLERCHMVQNEQQYIFIHQCLLYVLENEGAEICKRGSYALNDGTIEFPNSIISNDINMAANSSEIQANSNNGSVVYATGPTANKDAWITAPRIEVHQNSAFDDDEGIAESGL